MIYDKLDNIDRYSALFPELTEFIKKTNLNTLSLGKNGISDSMFVLVNEYDTSSEDIDVLENHAMYIDVQVLIKGAEKIAFATDYKEIIKEYDADADYELVKTEAEYSIFPEGSFFVLYPGEYHRPGISIENAVSVKKLVFKIKV